MNEETRNACVLKSRVSQTVAVPFIGQFQSQPPYALNEVQWLCPLEGRRVRKVGARNSERVGNEEACLIWIFTARSVGRFGLLPAGGLFRCSTFWNTTESVATPQERTVETVELAGTAVSPG